MPLKIIGLFLWSCLSQPVDTSVYWGTAIADVETTQSCLSRGTCREGHPLVPDNRAAAYGVKAAGHVALCATGKRWPIYVVSGIQGTVAGFNLRF